jgi:lipopolysaccharide transport system permease protein
MADTELETRERAPAPVAEQSQPASRVDRVTVIKPAPRWPHLDVPELWHYRELLGRLAWRDIAVRYKQTAIGISWALLQPFLMTIVFTLVFGRFANFNSKGVPYPIFSFSANLAWFYFASAVTLSSASLVSNRGLVTKVYFPRILLPLAAVTVPIIDLLFASVLLLMMWPWFHTWPSVAIVLAPAAILLALVTALGVGLLLSAASVRYRDVPFTFPFLLSSWMFLSGVIQPISEFPQYAQWVLALNPMTAVINLFQWGVIGTSAPDLGKTLVSVAAAAAFLVIGLWVFRRSEPRFADTI